MGILGAYLAYRYGRRKAEARLDYAHDDHPRLDEVCANCGHEFRFHADDSIMSCPLDIEL